MKIGRRICLLQRRINSDKARSGLSKICGLCPVHQSTALYWPEDWHGCQKAWLSRHDRLFPVGNSVIAAFGIGRAVEDARPQLAHDLSIITHDNELSYMRNGTTVPLFTATRSSVRDASRIGAERLMAQINEPRQASSGLLLEAGLTVSLSTGPALRNDRRKRA